MFSIALLLFCFSISNPSTRISVAVTAVMVAALIGWCMQWAREYSYSKAMWASHALPYITRLLNRVRGLLIDMFSLISRRESPPSLPGGHSGSLQAIPEHEIVGV